MARFSIEVKRSAVRELEHLPAKALRAVLARIESLRNNPRPSDCKKLSGEEKYRIRCGDYRILYLIEAAVLIVYVVKVRHRKDVYR